MMSLRLIPLLAIIASAVPSITDVIAKDEGGSRAALHAQKPGPAAPPAPTGPQGSAVPVAAAPTGPAAPAANAAAAAAIASAPVVAVPPAGPVAGVTAGGTGIFQGNIKQNIGNLFHPVGSEMHAAGTKAFGGSAARSNAFGGNAISSMGAAGGNPMGTMMESLLNGAGIAQPAAATPAHIGAVLSQDSMAVVSGLVEAFMHNVALAPGEKNCLVNNAGTLTGDVMGTVGDIVVAIKALVAGQGAIKKEASSSVISAGLDSAMKITSLVTLSTQLFQNCVHGDALTLMKTVAHHMVDGKYIEHNFVVNGVDIGHALADGVLAFEGHHFHRFGHDLGLTLRKILLSNATNGTRLPEGVPEEDIIQKTTDGLMKGFFVQGSAMKVTDTLHPSVDIEVDLHTCIAGNSAFFKELWLAAWDLIAQLSANGMQGLNAFKQKPGAPQPKWTGELEIAMLQFPMALNKCGVAVDTQNMLMDAIKSLNAVKVQFNFPDDRIRADHQGFDTPSLADGVTKKMAEAVKAWTNWDFEEFGFQLGKLLRELVLLAFPQKYSVDESDRLRLHSQMQVLNDNKASSISTSVVIGGGAVSLLFAFAVVRTQRSLPRSKVDHSLPESLSDMEDGETGLLVE